MFETLKTHIVFPLFSRAGTAVATLLVPHGINATYAEQVGIAVTAIGLIAFDLTVGFINRQNYLRKGSL